MGMFDTVQVNCPRCGKEADFQSKSGDCTLRNYLLAEAPLNVLADVNRHSPAICQGCKTPFGVARSVTRVPIEGGVQITSTYRAAVWDSMDQDQPGDVE